jgi:hypothetical protein
MSKMKRHLEEVMYELYPEGVTSEEEMWDCIAEADGHEIDYYADGDLAEWL